MTSSQTSMAGRDLEAAPKLDGLIQSSTTSILLASTPQMLPRCFDRPHWKAFVSGLPTLEPEQGSYTPVTRHSLNAGRLRDCQKHGRGGVTAITDQYYSRRIAVVLPSRNFPIHRGVTEK